MIPLFLPRVRQFPPVAVALIALRRVGLVLRAIFARNTRIGMRMTAILPLLLFLGSFLALNSPHFPVREKDQSSLAQRESFSLDSRTSSAHLSLSAYSLALSTVSNTSSWVAEPTFCDPSIQYSRQPAECQTAANTQRLALYLPIALAIVVGLLAVLLIFVLIRL